MNIHIHRGQNQIGGSIIEISDDTTRLFFDIGINLDEGDEVEVPEIDGLFYGVPNCNGVFTYSWVMLNICLTRLATRIIRQWYA